jgi:hypothetical protein
MDDFYNLFNSQQLTSLYNIASSVHVQTTVPSLSIHRTEVRYLSCE